jgi:hypothetical protein
MYNGEKLPLEIDNQLNNVIDAYEELTPTEKKNGYRYDIFLIIEED